MNKYRPTYYLIFVLSLFISQAVFGQRFQNINEEFPFTRIRNVAQDELGYLWIATLSGLIKYDGYTFRHYNSTNQEYPLSAQSIEAVYHDQNGNTWIGTKGNNGIEFLDPTTQQFQQVYFKNPKDNSIIELIDVYAITQDQDHLFWIGTNHGIYTFDPAKEDTISNRFIHKKDDPYSYDDYYGMEIFVDQHNQVWIGSMKGLNRYDRIKNRFINRKNNSNYLTGQILTIKETPKGELWVSGRNTQERIYRHLPQIDSFSSVFPFPVQLGTYFNFDFSNTDECWIASRGIGAIRYFMKDSLIEIFDGISGEFHGLTDLRSQCIFIDQYQNVWIGGRMLFKRPSTHKSIYNIKGNGYDVQAIHEEPEYLIFSLNEPYIWNKTTKQKKKFWTFPPIQNIRPNVKSEVHPILVYEYKKRDDRTLIFTSTRNIFSYDLITKKLIDYPQNQGGAFRDFEFGENNDMYISEGNHRPILFNFDETFSSAPKGLEISKALYATTVAKDQKGDLWFGPNNGKLIRYNETMDQTDFFPIQKIENGEKITANYVLDICPHSSGDYWIATEKGLWRMDANGTFTERIGGKNGLNSEYIVSVVEDDNQDIWVGTASGLSFINRTSLEVRNFTRHDGIINQRYTDASHTKGADGTLYFGGSNGIDFFHPSEIGINTIAPKILVDQIKVNNKSLTNLEFKAATSESLISFPYNQNYIQVELLALHLTAPSENKYSYRINDQPWTEAGKNRIVTLSNAQPGSYLIHAKVSNADGIWSEEKKVLEITIHPPWWKTWWFYSLSAILIGTSILLTYQYRIQQIRKQEALQTSFNKKIAEIEMKALRAQMNPHFLFNCLNSVKSLISKGENVSATTYLTKFSKLIRQILNNSRKKLVRLNDEIHALKLYLELESMRFGDTFEYEILIGEHVNSDFLEVPPLLLQPYVENAIWHGLLHKENGSRKLSIQIDREGEQIKMVVEDNGIGRVASEKLHTRSSSKQESLGMKITEDRLSLLKEIYGTTAGIKVIDLYDQNQVACGTRIEVSLPIPE